MHVLAGVFFEVQPRDPDLLWTPLDGMTRRIAFGSHDLQLTIGGERLIVLRDLITLWQVRIEVVLAREDRLMIDTQPERQCRPSTEFDGATIQDRQRTGQAETRRAGVCVWFITETRCAATEDLGFRAQLRVNLETDNCFPGHVKAMDGASPDRRRSGVLPLPVLSNVLPRRRVALVDRSIDSSTFRVRKCGPVSETVKRRGADSRWCCVADCYGQTDPNAAATERVCTRDSH